MLSFLTDHLSCSFILVWGAFFKQWCPLVFHFLCPVLLFLVGNMDLIVIQIILGTATKHEEKTLPLIVLLLLPFSIIKLVPRIVWF